MENCKDFTIAMKECITHHQEYYGELFSEGDETEEEEEGEEMEVEAQGEETHDEKVLVEAVSEVVKQ